MNKFMLASAAAIVLSGEIRADAINTTGQLSAFPAAFSSLTPSWSEAASGTPPSPSIFWNNTSYDSVDGNHQMNVGYLLTDSGGFAGTPSVIGSDSVSEALTAQNGVSPTDFTMVQDASSYNISLLFADSSLDTGNAALGTVFGYYVGNTFHPIYTVDGTQTPIDTEAFAPTAAGNSFGFYATVCYAVGICETYTSGGSNWGNDGGAAGWNHFALFQLASGNYAIGFEDTNGLYSEGGGDYNDVVVEISQAVVPQFRSFAIQQATAAVPEPACIGVVSLGLTALLYIRRRRDHSIRVAIPRRPWHSRSCGSRL